MTEKTGTILNIQRFSTEDGPGIRTTVFLKGCYLTCVWCQNPESWNINPQLVWHEDRCMGALNCLSICSENSIILTNKGITVDRSTCSACEKCISVCPKKAFEIIGIQMTTSELLSKLLRDEVFYDKSEGGVTLSGGDPLFQHEFSRAILKSLKEKKKHTAIDTSGFSSKDRFKSVVEYSDLILFDLKQMDSTLHKKATGIGNEKILENAKWLNKQKDKEIWIRTPIIPNYTDQEENVQLIAEFIQDHMPNAARWDLLCYNNLSIKKWSQLNQPYKLNKEKLISKSRIEQLASISKESNIPTTWTGVVI